jgi:hypothetical protein
VPARGAFLKLVHQVIRCRGVALFPKETQNTFWRTIMNRLVKLLIPLSLMTAAMTGCVVVPGGWHRGYYGPRVAVVAPAPVVVVRPYR